MSDITLLKQICKVKFTVGCMKTPSVLHFMEMLPPNTCKSQKIVKMHHRVQVYNSIIIVYSMMIII